MADNAFTGLLPDNFGTLQKLQALLFDDNQLGRQDSNDLSFITSLANCTNLRVLAMIYNNLRGPLPESIGNFSSKLSELRLGSNYITGRIPSEVGTLVGLERLVLDTNMLTGHIPDTIGRLTKLQELYISGNKLSGDIPSSIGNLTQLRILSLGDNLLEGVIPTSLGDCSRLESVYLSNNHLEGEILFVNFSSSIFQLLFRGNNLSGSLPLEISNLRNLNRLDVSSNRLSGRIPSALEACKVLGYLNLSQNTFEGSISSSFRKMRSLQVIDLSRNNLSGQIPYFLGELDLTSFNLSFNNFEGEVPTNGVLGNASAFSVLGNNLLCGGVKELRLAACPTKASKGKMHFSLKAIIAISIVPFIIFLLACFFLIKHRKKQTRAKTSDASPLENEHPRLTYATLLDATDGFSSTNLIGKGRYGSVYKGILGDGGEQLIAVKVFDLQQQGANRIFVGECEALKTIKHRNLVKIITSCSSIDFQGNDFKALVFEFIPKGSLQDWLHPNSSELPHSRSLNFAQRLDIAIDAASAVDYLHTQCVTPMVHCDLKPSNILLKDDLSACVSDFGLTKFLSMAIENSVHDLEQSSSIGVRGTIGYIAPEYGLFEEVSTSGDVYSYGILLMELFTGKSPTSSMFTGHFNLHDFVKASLPDRVTELIDPRLLELEGETTRNIEGSDYDKGKIIECLVTVCRIGLMCSAQSPTERPDIGYVLAQLVKIKHKLLIRPRGRNRNRR